MDLSVLQGSTAESCSDNNKNRSSTVIKTNTNNDENDGGDDDDAGKWVTGCSIMARSYTWQLEG